MNEGHVPEIFENRLIVLMEDIEEGVFNQVLLTKEMYKKVSDAVIVEIVPDEDNEMRPGFEMVRYNIDEDKEFPADLFIGLKSIDE